MLNTKKSFLALGFGIGLTSLLASAAPECNTDARCYMQNSRDISACMRTSNPVYIDGVRYDRYNTRAECESYYQDDLARCLAGDYDGPGRPAGC